tara:strand:+ start:1562 stop:1777 length:216 start_codon:yes stop_codon:yes gene_type:complete
MKKIEKINIKELSRKLAINELKEIYGESAIYVNNYDEFRGLVLHEKVKEPYNKILEKYNTIINNSIYKDEN